MLKITIRLNNIYEYMLSVFIIMLMSNKSFMTLNNFMFGTDSIFYRLLQYIILIVLVISFIFSIKSIVSRMNANSVVLYFIFLFLAVITYFFADGAKEVIVAEKLFSNVFIYGISGLIVIQTVKNYDIFCKTLRYFSYGVVIYSAIILMFGEIGSGYMGFSYAILLYVIALLYFGLFQKNNVALIFGLIGTVVNIFGGTRGSLICLAALALIFMIFSKRWKLIAVLLSAAVVIGLSFNYIINFISLILANYGINSRIVEAILGTGMTSLSDSNGRIEIWNVSIQLIKDNLLGYGFLGERAFINSKIWWFTTNGYAHNIFIELILQFGVIIGGCMIIYLFYKILYFFKRFTTSPLCGIITIYLCYCMNLLVSRSYTTTFEFWCLLGLLFVFPHALVSKSTNEENG